MTKAEAEEILRVPRFGDPKCIEAVERLRQEERIQELRARLVGKRINCGPCGGDGCEHCNETGLMTITQALAECWDLDILQEVWEEIREGGHSMESGEMNNPRLSAFDEALLREHHAQIRAGMLEPGPADPYMRNPSETLCQGKPCCGDLFCSRPRDEFGAIRSIESMFNWSYWLYAVALGLLAGAMGSALADWWGR